MEDAQEKKFTGYPWKTIENRSRSGKSLSEILTFSFCVLYGRMYKNRIGHEVSFVI